MSQKLWGPTWLWSCSSWIYNYLCNQCLSPLKLWVWSPFMARCTRYNIMWWFCEWLATGQWFSPCTLVSFTNKTDHHDILKYCWKRRKHHKPTKPTNQKLCIWLNTYCTWLISGWSFAMFSIFLWISNRRWCHHKTLF